ncbi:hypothetical protein B296_00034474 [Ensete ventricosum]|uniref:Uncharacterized protein n=1 Tax=Ensete ventricosum TaxID=4639 RepID=A0A426XHL6_ENSVE|nr:hypothetical protein B296_00034474 [Ensete ventricosum]
MSRVSACRVSCTTALSLHSPLFRNVINKQRRNNSLFVHLFRLSLSFLFSTTQSHRSSVRATVHRCPPALSLQRGESEKTCRPSLALKGEQDLTYSLSKPNLVSPAEKPGV